MSSIDEAVRRILRVKMKLGLFENPYVDVIPEEKRYLLPEYLKVAEELAAESMVLLKNDKETLPITSKYKNLAIIGPMVKDSTNIMGSWVGSCQLYTSYPAADLQCLCLGGLCNVKTNTELCRSVHQIYKQN